MSNKAIHPLDALANQWKAEEEAFFLDVPISEDYVVLEKSRGLKNFSAIKKHELGESTNLESLYNERYRDPGSRKFVPLFTMFSDMFLFSDFGPEELDFGTVIIYSDYKKNDCFGEIGNIRRSGWVVSQRMLELLKQFNIGEYKTYKIQVYHKGKNYDNYVYFHFLNYADKFIDYPRSKFYIQEGYLGDKKEMIDISSREEFETKKEELDKRRDRAHTFHLHPKELFLTENNLDLFKVKNPWFINYFASKRLAEALVNAKITGLDILQTTKVKKISQS